MKFQAVNAKFCSSEFVPKTVTGVEKILGDAGRHWQLEVYEMMKDTRFGIIGCPPGAGKSTAQISLAIRDIQTCGSLNLFLIPQGHQFAGFFKRDGGVSTIQIEGKTYSISCSQENNFCDNSIDSCNRLRDLLLTPREHLAKEDHGNTLRGRFAIATYAAFNQTWQWKLSEAEKAIAIKNLTVRADEWHHVCTMKTDGNQIGGAIRYILDSPDHTSKVFACTATNFRFRDSILSRNEEARFKKYQLPFAEHWASLGIEKMSLSCEMYKAAGHGPIDIATKNLLAGKSKEYAFVAVQPGVNREAFVTELIKRLVKGGISPKQILNLTSGSHEVLSAMTGVKQTQESNKKRLIAEPKTPTEGEPNFKVIVTCMLGREGTDICYLTQLHVCYLEQSPVLAGQTLGRLLRRWRYSVEPTPKCKTHAAATYYFPEFTPQEGATQKELLDSRLNALLIFLQAEEDFFPLLDTLMTRVTHEAPGGPPRDRHLGPFEMGVGSTKYNAMRKEFLTRAIKAQICGDLNTVSDFEALVDDVLDYYHVPNKSRPAGRETIETWWIRATQKFEPGVSCEFVAKMGFPSLFEKVNAASKTLVFSKDHDAGKIEQLRGIVKSWLTSEEARNAALLAECQARIKNAEDWVDLPKELLRWTFKKQQQAAKGASNGAE